jgi:hypothetical protein
MPLEMEADMALGCTASIRREARDRSLANGFSLHELSMEPTSSHHYLAPSSSSSAAASLWHIGGLFV